MLADLSEESKHKLQNTHIYIDEKNKNELKQIYQSETSSGSIIKINCEYKFYYKIIFDNTSLPEIIIKLICLWIHDEVELEVFRTEDLWIPVYEKHFSIESIDPIYINFHKIHTENILIVDNFTEEYQYNIYFSESVLQFKDKMLTTSEQNEIMESIYETTIDAMKEFKKIDNNMIINADYDLWLIMCNIINILICTINQF